MLPEIETYHRTLAQADRNICEALYQAIDNQLPHAEVKIWHRHPVWFIKGNPVVGYHKLKSCVRLLFWSGQSFNEPGLLPEGSFKAAVARYTHVSEIDHPALGRWLNLCPKIQWDYKNIVKRKGQLEMLSC